MGIYYRKCEDGITRPFYEAVTEEEREMNPWTVRDFILKERFPHAAPILEYCLKELIRRDTKEFILFFDVCVNGYKGEGKKRDQRGLAGYETHLLEAVTSFVAVGHPPECFFEVLTRAESNRIPAISNMAIEVLGELRGYWSA